MNRYVLTTLISLCVASNAWGAIEVVSSNDAIIPIDQLAKDSTIYDVNSHKNYNRNKIKTQLFNKYKTIDNMLLHVDKFSSVERDVMRELYSITVADQQAKIDELKQQQKINLLRMRLKNQAEQYKTLNNPHSITERRKQEDKVQQAQRKALQRATINIQTTQFDPNSSEQITINTVINRPSVISFFDMTGSPYHIASHIPSKETENTEFEVIKKNKNQLLILAKENYREISGFVFLEGVSQPIPIFLSSDTNRKIDVKRNVILPSVSPHSEEKAKKVAVAIQQLNKDDDPVMYRLLNGRPVPDATSLKVDGLPPNSNAYRHGKFVYIRTQEQMLYDIHSAIVLGSWYVYKAYPRASYWFHVNNTDHEVRVNG